MSLSCLSCLLFLRPGFFDPRRPAACLGGHALLPDCTHRRPFPWALCKPAGPQDRREHPRTAAICLGTVATSSARFVGYALDLSAGGLAFRAEYSIFAGLVTESLPCGALIELASPLDESRVTRAGQLLRLANTHLAVRFETPLSAAELNSLAAALPAASAADVSAPPPKPF